MPGRVRVCNGCACPVIAHVTDAQTCGGFVVVRGSNLVDEESLAGLPGERFVSSPLSLAALPASGTTEILHPSATALAAVRVAVNGAPCTEDAVRVLRIPVGSPRARHYAHAQVATTAPAPAAVTVSVSVEQSGVRPS